MVSCNDRVTPNGKENCEWKWKIFDISDAVLFLPVFIIKPWHLKFMRYWENHHVLNVNRILHESKGKWKTLKCNNPVCWYSYINNSMQ